MLKNVYIVFITLLYGRLAYSDRETSPNVGSVLFTSKDNHKSQWTTTDISLLQARKYFQSILPPTNQFINTFNDGTVDSLLNYFRDAYTLIKKEATDPETDTIMASALSDALGGYLKLWILPIAKLDYYGGTLSQDYIIKLYQFYNEIKTYLNTDGAGWRCPKDELLNSMSINVAPLVFSYDTRSTLDPCGQLSGFEKTDKGTDIPQLPSVYWNTDLSAMFIPLKDSKNLISINKLDTSNALLKYYDIAKKCVAINNPTESETFENKFQTWLAQDIMPHLKDDNLYLGLGSVLALVNRSQINYDSLVNKMHSNKKYEISKLRCIDFKSKKMMLLFLVLFIEVAWCIAALVYILCKKKNGSDSKLCMFLKRNPQAQNKKDPLSYFRRKKQTKHIQIFVRPGSHKNFINTETQQPSGSQSNACTYTSEGELSYRPQSSFMEFETQCPSSMLTANAGTGSRTFHSVKNQSADVIRVLDPFGVPKKSSMKKFSDGAIDLMQNAQILSFSNQNVLIPPHNTSDCSKALHKISSHKKDSSSKRKDKKESKDILRPSIELKGSKSVKPKHSNQSKHSKDTPAGSCQIENTDVITLKMNAFGQDSYSAVCYKPTESSDSTLFEQSHSAEVQYEPTQMFETVGTMISKSSNLQVQSLFTKKVDIGIESSKRSSHESSRKSSHESGQKSSHESIQKSSYESSQKNSMESSKKISYESSKKNSNESSKKSSNETSQKNSNGSSQNTFIVSSQKNSNNSIQKCSQDTNQKSSYDTSQKSSNESSHTRCRITSSSICACRNCLQSAANSQQEITAQSVNKFEYPFLDREVCKELYDEQILANKTCCRYFDDSKPFSEEIVSQTSEELEITSPCVEENMSTETTRPRKVTRFRLSAERFHVSEVLSEIADKRVQEIKQTPTYPRKQASIVVDNSNMEISIDVDCPCLRVENIKKKQPRSKIPVSNFNAHKSNLKISRSPTRVHAVQNPDGNKRRSFIPQLKKKAVDDIGLGYCTCCKANERLNETF